RGGPVEGGGAREARGALRGPPAGARRQEGGTQLRGPPGDHGAGAAAVRDPRGASRADPASAPTGPSSPDAAVTRSPPAAAVVSSELWYAALAASSRLYRAMICRTRCAARGPSRS